MNEQPPGPPPGNYPPPPHPSGSGFPQQYSAYQSPAGGFAPMPGYGWGAPPPPGLGPLPTSAYTPWIHRVLAFLIDYIPYLIIVGIGWGILLGTQQCVDFADTGLGEVLGESYGAQVCDASTIGQTAVTLAGLVGLGYVLWNYGYRQGTTGSSIGKSVMRFRVLSEKTGQPLGFGPSIIRQLAHVVDLFLCGLGFLFPLWDNKRQTLADKIMATVCLPR
ncbi:RDD family protein [Mycolicibacterium mengxianglii]|uniref:RDD family protein n=1 Tax=Mycolicibacterium mengxianglii TaxID=2736649 RepID=UPI0018EF2812|nr:RDD family protein [Mycolicibacterium mengxianglii]